MTTSLEAALEEFDAVVAMRDPAGAASKKPGLDHEAYRRLEEHLAPWRLPGEVEVLYHWSAEHHGLFGRGLMTPDALMKSFTVRSAVVWLPPLLVSPTGYWGGVELGFEDAPQTGRLWWVGHGDPDGRLLYSSIEHFVRTMTEMTRRWSGPDPIWGRAPGDEEFFDLRVSLADGLVMSREHDNPETHADIYATPFNGGEMEYGWPRRWYELYEAAASAGHTSGLDPFA